MHDNAPPVAGGSGEGLAATSDPEFLFEVLVGLMAMVAMAMIVTARLLRRRNER